MPDLSRLVGKKQENGVYSLEEPPEVSPEEMEKRIKKMMLSIDARVGRLVETFRFILKYKIVLTGNGVEFAKLREYTPQDDASRIDWKTSVRMSTSRRVDNLYIRVYEEERDLDVFVLVDASSSMYFGTTEMLKSEYAAILSGAIVHATLEVGDAAGMALFGDHIKKFVPPSRAGIQYYRCLRELADERNYGGGCNLLHALEVLEQTLRPRTMLFIISDFIGVGTDWTDKLKSLCHKFEAVIGLMVRDVRDSFLPEGVGNFRLQDPFTGEVVSVNLDKVRKEYEQEAHRQEEFVRQQFEGGGGGFVKYYTTEDFVKPLIKYLDTWGAGRG